MRIALTGATGYVGGRLVPQLLEAGHEVVCLARNPEKLAQRSWRELVEARQADVLDTASVDAAMADCDAAYYLIHSMGSSPDFEDADRRAAANVAAAAESAGLRRIIYLGGLGGSDDDLSPHLSSRHAPKR